MYRSLLDLSGPDNDGGLYGRTRKPGWSTANTPA